MDEYLSEKEQIERIRDWWRENAWYLIGGVVLGVAGILGYGRYQDYAAGNAEAAAALYRQLEAAANDDNLADVERLLGTLRAEHESSIYADQGALLAARVYLIRDTERAVSELRGVMDSADRELAMIARMRLARVLAYQEKYDEALGLLDVADPGPFAARISEIRGDVHFARGDVDAARAAFAEALITTGADLLDRNFVQMKLADLSDAAVTLEASPGAIEPPPSADEQPTAGEAAAPAGVDAAPAVPAAAEDQG